LTNSGEIFSDDVDLDAVLARIELGEFKDDRFCRKWSSFWRQRQGEQKPAGADDPEQWGRAGMHRSTDNSRPSSSGDSESTGDAQFLPGVPLPQKIPTKPVAIADMANLFGVTHRTLHFYEEKKLLQPSRIGAMRVYSPRQVKVMALINLCRETGMPVLQIQDLLTELSEAGSQQECDEIFRVALTSRKKELMSDESLLRRQMQQINEILSDGSDESLLEGNDNRQLSTPFLSEAEFQCLKLMAEGYTPVRIANTLRRPFEDILATEANIVKKFGSSNRFQAVAKAVLLGLLGD
jgi:DNA-binding transcriptional MerR regulator